MSFKKQAQSHTGAGPASLVAHRAAPQGPSDAGFSLVELLVVMIVVGLLAGASVPLFRDEQRRSLDRTVAADLNRYEVAAERLFSATYGYPVTNTGFDLHDQGNPDASSGNTFRAFTVPSGAWAGYVVYGQNSTTSSVFVLSSYTGGDPVATSLRTLPTVPPTAGTLNVPASVLAASWSSLPGLTWGAVNAISGATRIPFYDPTLLSTVKVPSSTAPAGNIYPYNPALFRIVDLASPVASRAVEVVTTTGTAGQGLIIYPQTPAASWPAITPVGAAGEQWTVSAWVRAGAGQGMSIGCRVQSSSLTYVTEVNGAGSSTVEATTGDWQRISFTCTAAASWVGKYVAVEVFTPDTTPGRTYYVTAPQLNKGSVASPFSLG